MVDRAAIAAGFATLRDAMPQIQQAVHDELHTDAYTCWTVNRPAGWADGTDVEAQAVVASGTGKLYANGAGGPIAAEGMVIHTESPYRFRTFASDPVENGHLVAINDARLFRVDVVKREGADDRLMDVYLTELFATPMPEVP